MAMTLLQRTEAQATGAADDPGWSRVRSVRDHLSHYLRRVRRGERVVVTDRGDRTAG
jgi:hypothetical protein